MLAAQAVRYVVVGALGTVTHLALLVFAVELAGFGVVAGSVLGFLAALLVSYELNNRWTFRVQRARLSSFWRYGTITVGGLLFNAGMMHVLVDLLAWPYLVAQAVLLPFVPVSNFLLSRHWVFAAGAGAGAPLGQSSDSES